MLFPGGIFLSVFWAALWGALSALVLGGLLLLLAGKKIGYALVNSACSHLMLRVVKDPYPENLFGVVNVMRHTGGEFFVETLMRAKSGKPLSRPLGSPYHLSPWEKLLFQPVYLRPRLPPPENKEIRTATTLGRTAERPLKLDIPLMLGGMSYGGALSARAKIALAKGANLAGTATNTGESYLPEERQASDRLIVQHHRGLWPNSTMRRPELLKYADAIEIQLGQGAQAASAMRTPARTIDKKMADVYGLEEGEDAKLATRFSGLSQPSDFVQLVRRFKSETPVPVGVKIGVGGHLEEDLEVFMEAGVDFITLDGAEGGTHGGPPTLQDDVGLPTLHGIVRADDFLRRTGGRERVTLVASGGLTTPGTMLKALALGADLVALGSVAVIAVLTTQMEKATPGEPPYDMVMHMAPKRYREHLNIDSAARHLDNYLRSAVAEMAYVVQALGREAVEELSREDLVALEPWVADLTGVPLAWTPRSQDRPVEASGSHGAHHKEVLLK